jgi:alkylmercury lyase
MSSAQESSAQDMGAIDARGAFADYLERRVPVPNTPQMQKRSVALYRLLGNGAPATRDQLGAACGISREQVAQLLLEFPPTTVTLDACAAVIAFGGLSLSPTPHRFFTHEAKLHTWCVFDALFLPEVLDKPATLVTHCPGSGVELRVELAPGEVRVARPADCVMSIVTPDDEACCANLRKAFCDHVNLFRGEQAFIAWSQGRRDVACVTLREAQLLARRRNLLRYPDVELIG